MNDSFPPVIDGVANVVLNYANILNNEQLANVTVATTKYPNVDYSVYPYKVIPYQSFNTTKLINGYRTGNPLDVMGLKALRESAPDIIHTHSPFTSTVMARMLRFSSDAPVVFTYHTKYNYDIEKAVSLEILQKEAIKTIIYNISACDEVWVVSEGAGENLKSLGYEGDYRIVSNGVDFEKGRVSQAEVDKINQEYDLPEGVPVFLYVGRLEFYKNIPLVIDGLAKFEECGYDYRFVVVGKGIDAEKIRKMAAKKLKPAHVIFTGAVYDREKLRAFYTRANLFLFASTYDTNGIVVREAAACGLASMLVRGSCAAEGVTDGQNGFLVEENSESIAELLKSVHDCFDYMYQVGDNAMNEIYISWTDSVHDAYERYNELIELKKSGSLILNHHALSTAMLNIKNDIHGQYLKAQGDFLEQYEKVQNGLDKLKSLIHDDEDGFFF